MKLRKIHDFLGVVYEGGGKRTGKGVVKTCVKHNERERGYWDHPQAEKAQRDCCIRVVSD